MSSAPFTSGSYRRRIRLVALSPTAVHAALEDDFHHFEVTLHHDGERVRDVDARSVRWPWTTCPSAAGPLRELAGMELSTRCLAVGGHADPRANCTHMFDLAGLAVAHAARGIERRQYDAEVPLGTEGGARTVRLWRDGEPLLEWTIEGGRVEAPAPFDEAPWRGGFFRWAEATFPDVDDSEAAIVLRRSCEIGGGRGMDLDAFERASELDELMSGVCYTMQRGIAEHGLRNRGAIRDFDPDPDALLSERG